MANWCGIWLSVGFVGDMTDIRCRIGFPEHDKDKIHTWEGPPCKDDGPTDPLIMRKKKCWKGHTCVKKKKCPCSHDGFDTQDSKPITRPLVYAYCKRISILMMKHTKSAFWCFSAGWSDQHQAKSKLQPQFGGLNIWKWSNKIVLLLFFFAGRGPAVVSYPI